MTDKLAEVIKNMTQQEVSCASPTVETAGRDQLLAKVPEVVIAVMADYSAGLGGDHLFLMPSEMATKLVGFINQEENACRRSCPGYGVQPGKPCASVSKMR